MQRFRLEHSKKAGYDGECHLCSHRICVFAGGLGAGSGCSNTTARSSEVVDELV